MYKGNPPPLAHPLCHQPRQGGSPAGGQWLASSEDVGARSWRLLVMKMRRGGQRGVLMNTRPPGPILRPRTRGPHSVHDLAPDVNPGRRVTVHSTRASVQGVATSALLSRGGRQVGGRAGWGRMVGRKAEKSRARGKGCVHGRRRSRGVGGRAASVGAGAKAGATAAGWGSQATPVPPSAPRLSAQSVQALRVLQHFLDERRHGARDLHLQRDHPLGPCRRGGQRSANTPSPPAPGGRAQRAGGPELPVSVSATLHPGLTLTRRLSSPQVRGAGGKWS